MAICSKCYWWDFKLVVLSTLWKESYAYNKWLNKWHEFNLVILMKNWQTAKLIHIHSNGGIFDNSKTLMNSSGTKAAAYLCAVQKHCNSSSLGRGLSFSRLSKWNRGLDKSTREIKWWRLFCVLKYVQLNLHIYQFECFLYMCACVWGLLLTNPITCCKGWWTCNYCGMELAIF